MRDSTLCKIEAAACKVAEECVVAMKDGGRGEGKGATATLPLAPALRKRFQIGTSSAEAALCAAQAILLAAGAEAVKHRRSVLFSAGSIELEAAEHHFRQRHLAYMKRIEEQELPKRKRQHLTGLSCESSEKKRRGPVINITAAADALTAGLRNALHEGADAIVFAPGPHSGGSTNRSVQARFKCGADVSDRVIRHAQARLSMAGYKSEGYAKNPRQMVYYRVEEGAKDKKRPLACPGLAPTKRLKEEVDADVPPSLPPARKALHQIVGRPLPGVALKLEEQECRVHQKPPCQQPLCRQPPCQQSPCQQRPCRHSCPPRFAESCSNREEASRPTRPQSSRADPQHSPSARLGPADSQCSTANPQGSLAVPQCSAAALISDESVRWSWALLQFLENDPLRAARPLAAVCKSIAAAIARDAGEVTLAPE